MSRLLDDEQDELPQRERELTLSTGAILAIFLGLVVLCGVFFGFGYNLGRKSSTAPTTALPAAASDAEPADAGSSNFDNFKPSPSSPRASASTTTTTPPPPAGSAPTVTRDTEPEAPTAKPSPPTPPPSHAASSPAPTTSAPARAAEPAAPAVTPGGAFVVQIAAISPTHKDDADLLASALRGRGYTVAERVDATDKLIHVQVGPFATKADAEAMRERLVVDGYNPIIK
jgi:DedD protein